MYKHAYLPNTLTLGKLCRLELLALDSKVAFAGKRPSNNTITYKINKQDVLAL